MLEVNTKAPDFTLCDKEGNLVSLSDFHRSYRLSFHKHLNMVLVYKNGHEKFNKLKSI